MFDKDTRTVSYDAGRGEPRANRRNADANSGDCVDCGLCVQVCPTGIDIRDGLQAACIDCAACIDACDNVMTKLNRPSGLIRFASEAQLSGQTSPILRARLVGYATIMLIAGSAVLYGFTRTTSLLIEIRKDRNALYTRLNERTLCNNYRIKIEAFTENQALVEVSLSGSGHFELFGPSKIDLRENSSTWLPYRVCAKDLQQPRADLTFYFKGENETASKATTFLTQAI